MRLAVGARFGAALLVAAAVLVAGAHGQEVERLEDVELLGEEEHAAALPLGRAVGESKELASAKLRKPVGHVLKSQLPDGPKAKAPKVPKAGRLPSQKTMKAAALAHATHFRARTAKIEAKENREKVSGITSRERARKATQPRPPKQGLVKLKVTAANEAAKKQERSVKRNAASEKQRKQAEFERGGLKKSKPKPAAAKHDERKMKASEMRLKASERRVKRTPPKVITKVVHHRRPQRPRHHRKPRKHRKHRHKRAAPVKSDEREQKKDMDTRANHHVAHEHAKKAEAKAKEKVQKSKARHSKHTKKHHKAAGKVKELHEKSTTKPGAFVRFNSGIRHLRKGASARVHAATHPALGENRKDFIERKLEQIKAEKSGDTGSKNAHGERQQLIHAASSIAGTPPGKARAIAKKSLELVARDMSKREHGRLNVQSALKGLKKDETRLLSVAKSVAHTKRAKGAKKSLMVAAKMVSKEEKKERAMSGSHSSHHHSRMPAERAKLLVEAKEVGRLPLDSPAGRTAKKAIKLVARDMVARERGTLNAKASLKDLRKDEKEILNVARREARVEHGAKRAGAKEALVVAAKAVSTEEKKERALSGVEEKETMKAKAVSKSKAKAKAVAKPKAVVKPKAKPKEATKPKAKPKAVAKPKAKPKEATKPKAKPKAAAKPKAKAKAAAKPKSKSFLNRFSTAALGKDLKALSTKADHFINNEVARETKSTKKDLSVLQHDTASFQKKVEQSAALKMKMKDLERKDKRVAQQEKRMASAMVKSAMAGNLKRP